MMKKEGELFSSSVSSGSQGKGITRSEFLKGTAGLVLLLGSGFTLKGLAEIADPAEPPVGPQLREELNIIKTDSGATVTAAGQTCFTVNDAGMQLLKLADGSRTLDEIIRICGMAAGAEAVADFFLTLGKAGYLTARLEVNKIAVIQ